MDKHHDVRYSLAYSITETLIQGEHSYSEHLKSEMLQNLKDDDQSITNKN